MMLPKNSCHSCRYDLPISVQSWTASIDIPYKPRYGLLSAEFIEHSLPLVFRRALKKIASITLLYSIYCLWKA